MVELLLLVVQFFHLRSQPNLKVDLMREQILSSLILLLYFWMIDQYSKWLLINHCVYHKKDDLDDFKWEKEIVRLKIVNEQKFTSLFSLDKIEICRKEILFRIVKWKEKWLYWYLYDEDMRKKVILPWRE